ncbi:hypothetical protein CAPTEDRAFT_222800 [Capitella teleta]|uniref:Uncharacterized protein n=1 Tax=Capitella teleta TaxID=283909 RepID=R7TGI8_CAPTE|nr:hypothetical protein CAPTEDRAFT_222800 [Capitella teleta]|eukprot:ELT90230.1 hypothetical protein CAPTEDRAFT_222800 [Capitella teleta]
MSFVQLLPAAITDCDEETLESLLTAGIDVNHPVHCKDSAVEVTPLCLAAEFGSVDVARALVTHGASVTAGTKASVASSAVRSGSVIYVNLRRRRNAMHLEAHQLTASVNATLVKALTSPNVLSHPPRKKARTSDEGLTALMVACRHGRFSMVEYLLTVLREQGVLEQQLMMKDSDGMDAFAAACIGGHLEVMKRLLPLYPEGLSLDHPNKLRQNSLILASLSGSSEAVRYLVEKGASWQWTDEHDYDVLVYATYFSQLPILKVLHDLCPPLLFKSNARLCLELALSDSQVFKYLVCQCGLSPRHYTDIHCNSILHRAVNHPQISPDLVSYILQHVDVNHIDYQGETALGILLQNPRKTLSSPMITQLAELLLNAGCNPNVPAPPRVPPLFMAVNMQSPPLVDLLIRYGANVCVKDLCDGTPLCALVTNISRTNVNHVPPSVRAIMESLMDADPSVGQEIPDHVAFYGLSLTGELVQFIMQKIEERGCNLKRLISEQGLSLLQTAILRYNFHAVKYFLQRGFPLDTWVTVPPVAVPVFILNAYLGWNNRLVKCTPEIDEFNMVNKRDPSKSRTSRCRRYSMARWLTISGVPWSSLATIVTPSLRSSCLQMFPISLQHICRNSLREHFGMVHAHAPWIYHLYNYRNGIDTVESFMNFFDTYSKAVPVLKVLSVDFAKDLVTSLCSDDASETADMATDGFSFATWMVARALSEYMGFREKGINIPCVKYELLLEDPRGNLEALSHHFGLELTSDEIDNALLSLNKNSQEGLIFGRDNSFRRLKSKRHRDIRQDCVDICKRMGVPSIYSDELLPGVITTSRRRQ